MKYDNLPVARALSMGVHESQSLLWQRMVFQSSEFWEWATPIVHKYFPHTADVTSEEFFLFVNQVGYIIVEAFVYCTGLSYCYQHNIPHIHCK